MLCNVHLDELMDKIGGNAEEGNPRINPKNKQTKNPNQTAQTEWLSSWVLTYEAGGHISIPS